MNVMAKVFPLNKNVNYSVLDAWLTHHSIKKSSGLNHGVWSFKLNSDSEKDLIRDRLAYAGIVIEWLD